MPRSITACEQQFWPDIGLCRRNFNGKASALPRPYEEGWLHQQKMKRLTATLEEQFAESRKLEQEIRKKLDAIWKGMK